jgi:hypothetical protein
MMMSSVLARRAPAMMAAVKMAVAPSLVCFPVDAAASQHNSTTNQQLHQQLQVRCMVTKKRVHRQVKHQRKSELAEKGIFPPKPNNYIPKDTPVINAVPRAQRDADSKRQDEIAAQELKGKMEIVKAPLMRFGFSDTGKDLVMSDRVQKLFDMNNGNQSEVVKAQKQRGMELFQVREGDTGTSAVQGEKKYNIVYSNGSAVPKLF